MQKNLTTTEQTELLLILEFITRLKNSSDEELKGLALDEMDKKQPALQNLARFLYLTKKFSMKQMMEITRLLILVWWYYNGWAKDENKKIDDPLYVEMRKKHEAFEGKMQKGNAPYNKQMMEESLKEYPARMLYGQTHRTIFIEKTNNLSTLSKADKAYLLSHFKIIMDCFEALVDRSLDANNLN